MFFPISVHLIRFICIVFHNKSPLLVPWVASSLQRMTFALSFGQRLRLLWILISWQRGSILKKVVITAFVLCNPLGIAVELQIFFIFFYKKPGTWTLRKKKSQFSRGADVLESIAHVNYKHPRNLTVLWVMHPPYYKNRCVPLGDSNFTPHANASFLVIGFMWSALVLALASGMH